MRRWAVRRQQPHGPAGLRQNQWKGERAESAAKQERVARRAQAWAKGRTLLRRGAFAAGAGLAGWAIVAGLNYAGPMMQRWLEVKTVTVEGLHRIPRQQVLAQVDLQPGTPLHHVVTEKIKERVELHPWVKEADVTRVPFHELRISVVERTPAAVIHSGTENYLSDDEGHVLAKLGQEDEGALPMVTGIDPKGLAQGDAAVRHAVKSGIELAKLVGNTLDGRLQVNAANPANLVASVRGVQFQFGQDALSDQWERFRRVKPSLKTLTFDGQSHGANEVDLRYENRVIVRERG